MSSSAQIYEQGYRRYDGVRLGRAAAVRSVWKHTAQRVLGLRRSARHKVLPFLAILMAYLPAIAFIGILALVPPDATQARDLAPSYAQYYGFVTAAIVLFIVFSAPEALCPDRRNRSMSLYLASPLTRETYLLAKALAVFSVLCLVTIGPLLLLLIGYVLQSHGPDGPVGVLAELVRILGAGVAVALFGTAFALALASLTDRKGLATGGALIVLFGTHIVGGVLAFVLQLSDAAIMLSLFVAPFEVAARILDAPASAAMHTGNTVVFVAALAWTALFSVLVYLRYASLQVTR
ncbi:MAG: ABC transporter permease subunit [Acidimicrobiales bacterium]